MPSLELILLAAAFPLVAALWAGKLRSARRYARWAAEEDMRRGTADTREVATAASMAMYRDGFLALISLVGIGYLIARLIEPGLTRPMTGKGDEMSRLPEILQHFLIALVAFLILYGLAVAILPEILPDKGTRRARWLSEILAAAIGGTVALTVATNDSTYTQIKEYIDEKAFGVVLQFIGILFAAMGVYLLWRKLKTVIKPVSSVEGRIRAERLRKD